MSLAPDVMAVMFAGQAMLGGCVSTSVTVKEQLAVLPEPSVATAVTVVVPLEKVEPDGGFATTVTPGQLSLAVTVKLTNAEHCPAAAGTVIFAGQVIVGA